MFKIILVIGPTSSGKSAWALQEAQKHNRAIINIDSAQVYKEISISPGCPTQQELSTVPHYLFNYRSAIEPYNIQIYLTDLYKTLEYCSKKYESIYIVGGSAMYIYCLLHGLNESINISKNTIQKSQEDYKTYGLQYIFDQMALKYANLSQHLEKNNTQRILRAYQVFLESGKLPHEFIQKKFLPLNKYYSNIIIKKLLPEKNLIYTKCQQRVYNLLKNGALEEAQNNQHIYNQFNTSAQKILLFKELNEFLSNKINENEMILKAQQSTRKYAKKQYTWYTNKI